MTAVLSLARSLHLVCVAEGIETVTQLELLRELGCDIGQGFLFAAPGPPEAVGGMLADASVGGLASALVLP